LLLRYYFIYLSIFFSFPVFAGGGNRTTAPFFAAGRVSIDFFRENDSTDFIIPFSRAGNLIVIKGRADSTDGNFMLDTGCPGLVLNVTYFRHYPTHASEEERNGATGAEFKILHSSVEDFSIGPYHYYKQPAELANLGNIENVKGIKVLGLVGMELLNKFEMIVDYEKNQLHMHRVERKEAATYSHPWLKDKSGYTEVPITISDNRIIVQTLLGGKKLKLVIDSGAESNLLDSRLPEKVFENVIVTGRTFLNGAGNKRLEVLKGDLSSLKIGDESVDKLPVLITNLERTCFSYGGCVDGILGFDFLSLRKIGFNFVKNKMYIWK
jgi:hypothetical protein